VIDGRTGHVLVVVIGWPRKNTEQLYFKWICANKRVRRSAMCVRIGSVSVILYVGI